MSVNQIMNSSMSWKKNDLMGEGDELVMYNPENLICLEPIRIISLKIYVLFTACDQTHTLSSLENILSVSIQYDYERITSGNIQNCCVRGHSLMTELIFHQISLSTRQRYILLDRMWNKAHKSVLYFTFCVIYFTLYPVLSTYCTGVYSLTIVLILYKRL